jgi:hypothetical protein
MKTVLAAAALSALLTTILVGCDPARGLLMSERQSGLTSAPMRGPSERTTVSSDSQSVLNSERKATVPLPPHHR